MWNVKNTQTGRVMKSFDQKSEADKYRRNLNSPKKHSVVKQPRGFSGKKRKYNRSEWSIGNRRIEGEIFRPEPQHMVSRVPKTLAKQRANEIRSRGKKARVVQAGPGKWVALEGPSLGQRRVFRNPGIGSTLEPMMIQRRNSPPGSSGMNMSNYMAKRRRRDKFEFDVDFGSDDPDLFMSQRADGKILIQWPESQRIMMHPDAELEMSGGSSAYWIQPSVWEQYKNTYYEDESYENMPAPSDVMPDGAWMLNQNMLIKFVGPPASQQVVDVSGMTQAEVTELEGELLDVREPVLRDEPEVRWRGPSSRSGSRWSSSLGEADASYNADVLRERGFKLVRDISNPNRTRMVWRRD